MPSTRSPQRAGGAFALAAALALGCASAPELPAHIEPLSVHLSDLAPLDAGVFEQQLRLDLRVTNPNPVDLPVRGLRYELVVGDEVLVKGTSPDDFVAPALADTRISTTATASSLALVRQLRALGQREPFQYTLSGAAFVEGRSEPLPFAEEGAVDLWGVDESERSAAHD